MNICQMCLTFFLSDKVQTVQCPKKGCGDGYIQGVLVKYQMAQNKYFSLLHMVKMSPKLTKITESKIYQVVLIWFLNHNLFYFWMSKLWAGLEKTNSMNSVEFNFFLDFLPNLLTFSPNLDPWTCKLKITSKMSSS